jgi:N-succinyldiaminopimelate aminotransferase
VRAAALAKFSPYASERVLREASGGTDAWAKIIEWSKAEGMLNLGQGFPDYVPASVMATLKTGVAEAMEDNALNQYSPQTGLPSLRGAIAELFRVFYGRAVDPATEVLVLPSGTSGIFAAVQAFCNPGDEVVIFEPCFPWYVPTVRLAGAVPRVVRLEAPGFRIERGVEAAFSERTKLCIVNSPHNPTGRVFDEDELAVVADLCRRHDVVCLSDEVYEGCVYPGAGGHRSIANVLDGDGGNSMRQRTVTLHSASKLFGVTGWRVGWIVGPAPMVSDIGTVHSYMT